MTRSDQVQQQPLALCWGGRREVGTGGGWKGAAGAVTRVPRLPSASTWLQSGAGRLRGQRGTPVSSMNENSGQPHQSSTSTQTQTVQPRPRASEGAACFTRAGPQRAWGTPAGEAQRTGEEAGGGRAQPSGGVPRPGTSQESEGGSRLGGRERRPASSRGGCQASRPL